MDRAILTIIFILGLAYWLKWETRKKVSLTKHWRWLLATALVQIIGNAISAIDPNPLRANIFLHAIGGGVASTLLFFYLIKTFEVRLNWRLTLVILFFFVSTLGVMNELIEYGLELMNFGIFSVDTHDTWRDFVSNSTGALTAWIVITASISMLGMRRRK